MKPTRRDAALALLLPPLLAQDAPAPLSSADELSVVRQQSRSVAELLRSFKVPVATEPSIIFKP